MSWQRWNSTSKIFELSTDDGANWNPLGLDAAILTQGIIGSIARIATGTPSGAKFVRDDLTLQVPPGTPTTSASDLTSGTLADARLSSNVPLKDAANTFSAAGNVFAELLAVSKGLSFPATQVASSGANDLDDYEEGTFTPTLLGSVSGSYSFASAIGHYIKIGRMVFYVFSNSSGGTNNSLTGSWQFAGLPFTSANPATLSHPGGGSVNSHRLFPTFPTGAQGLSHRVAKNLAYHEFLYDYDDGTESSAITGTPHASMEFMVTGAYLAAN